MIWNVAKPLDSPTPREKEQYKELEFGSYEISTNDMDIHRWAKPENEIQEEPIFVKTEPIEPIEEKEEKDD